MNYEGSKIASLSTHEQIDRLEAERPQGQSLLLLKFTNMDGLSSLRYLISA